MKGMSKSEIIQWVLPQSSSKFSISRIRLLLIKSRLNSFSHATSTDSLAATSYRSDPEAELASVSDHPSHDAVSRSSRDRSRIQNQSFNRAKYSTCPDRAGGSLGSTSLISTS